MGIKSLKKIRIDNRETDQLQENINQFGNQFLNKNIIDGLPLTNVVLTAGSVNEINHKLGRKIQGWIITRKKANSVIWDTQDSNTRSDRTLLLNVSANVTVDLWIF